MGNIGGRSRIEPIGRPLVPIEGQRLRDDFGSWSPRAHDTVPAGPTGTPRPRPCATALADRSAAALTGPARPLAGVFVPGAETVPGARRHWREP
ncbi:hypothetical protein ACWC4D_28740 [Streptomyces sp. NPDC001288]|uniref:hypothetical protein n=1 Tax=unclassified Streptomyces TaxID=2593676 RepID=UPI0033263F5C